MFDRRWLLASGLAMVGIFCGTYPARAGVLDAFWTAPTTNTDATPLTDLSFYRVYYGTGANNPCPSGTSVQVPSPTSTPPPGQIVGVRLTGLTTGTVFNVSVAAGDLSGNMSACTNFATTDAKASFTVTPTTTVAFGNVSIGSFAEQTFTVQSTRDGVSGTASVAAPFTIVSGSPFSLATTGATATIRVRFTPTTTTPMSLNVNFTADGDSVSRLVTGTGVAATSALTVTRAGAGTGTVTSSPAGINCGPTCSASFTTGTVVTLTAAPTGGSTFSGWSGACSGTGTCAVTMSQARAVTATFALPTFALTVTKAGAGTVTSNPAGINCGATCSASFANGTAVTLTAAPTAGSTFTGWSGACTGTGNCSVTMSAARAVTATFSVPVTFTDDPLTAQATVVKAVHVTELRAAIAVLRARYALPVFVWTDPTLAARTSVVKAVHISELRTALDDVYGQRFMPLPNYTDVTIVAGQTVSKAAHVQELRNAVRAVP